MMGEEVIFKRIVYPLRLLFVKYNEGRIFDSTLRNR